MANTKTTKTKKPVATKKTVAIKKPTKTKAGKASSASKKTAKKPISGKEAVKKLLEMGKKTGVISYKDLNKLLPADEFSPETIEGVIDTLSQMDIKVEEDKKAKKKKSLTVTTDDDVLDKDDSEDEAADTASASKAKNDKDDKYGRSDDPVRMYLREMGNVELLSREGEIKIAKRIESGRELMITALCETPIVMQQIMSWRDELSAGTVLLREVIDLDGTMGVNAEDNSQAIIDAENGVGVAAETSEEAEEKPAEEKTTDDSDADNKSDKDDDESDDESDEFDENGEDDDE